MDTHESEIFQQRFINTQRKGGDHLFAACQVKQRIVAHGTQKNNVLQVNGTFAFFGLKAW